jgi:hypothetical protein
VAEPLPYLGKLEAFCRQNCIDTESAWYERVIAALAT